MYFYISVILTLVAIRRFAEYVFTTNPINASKGLEVCKVYFLTFNKQCIASSSLANRSSPIFPLYITRPVFWSIRISCVSFRVDKEETINYKFISSVKIHYYTINNLLTTSLNVVRMNKCFVFLINSHPKKLNFNFTHKKILNYNC